MTDQLILEGVCKSYGDHVVLKHFSHRFPAERVTAIFGRSGCGKTTLLRLIAALEAPDAGSITGVPDGGLSMVFQEDRLPLQLNAADCIACVLKKAPDRQARIQDALQALGLGDVRDQPVRSFSGGMRRRVALARALLFPSPLVLLDEPFKGLDADTRDSVLAFARPLLAGRTTLLVTHDPSDAAELDAAVLRLDSATLLN